MLRLIFGRAGSGKSHYIKEKITELVKNKHAQTVLIVPEQSSFDSERELLNILGEQDYSNVSVLSFTRLSQKLPMLYKLSQIEGSCPIQNDTDAESIDMFGKIMLMSRSLALVRDKLHLYARQIKSTDFMLQLLTLFAEFKSSCIFPEDLLKCANRMKPCVLKQKLSELYEIYSIYNTLLKNKYLDAQDMLEQTIEILKRFDFFKDKTVFVDSFKDFTYQESEILRLIMKQCDDIYVSLCVDKLSYSLNDEFSMFCPCIKSARMLISIAKSENIPCAAPVEIVGSPRFKSKALAHLEKGLLNRETESFDGNADDITIYEATGCADEVEFAARSIRQLTKKGYRYKDIAVIARDMSQYDDTVETIFARYDIPVFLDKRSSIECTPLFFLVLSALDIASNGYDSDNIFKLLKSGLTDIPLEEISLIENYTLIWKISGNRWLSDFKGHPSGLGRKMDESSAEQLNRINELRKKIIAPLYEFREKCKNASGKQISEAVYALLLKLRVPEALRELSTLYAVQGENTLSEEQDRLWNLLMDILDRAYEILGDEAVDISVFTQMVRTAVSYASLGHIPQTLDCVSAGSAQRMKPNSPKVVFILGANDEVFPKKVSSTGLFNEHERRSLADAQMRLDFDMKEAVNDENLLLYQAVTCASEKLFVSTQSVSLSGELRLPSVLISEIDRLFPNAVHVTQSDDPSDIVFNNKTAFDLLAKTYNNASVLSASLCEYLSGVDEYSDKLNSLQEGLGSDLGSINEQSSQLLFENSKTLSSSKIESFYKCRYRYFCEYGLKLRRRESGDIDSRMFGTILHYCLEKLMVNIPVNELIDMPRDKRNALIEDIANEYCNEYMGGLDDKPTRFQTLYNRWVNNCKLIAAHIVKELSQSSYAPADFELKIGKDIPPYQIILSDDSRIKIIGSVDRVDIAQNAAKKYLRIIDYKSSKKQFKLSSVMDGLNMQMLIYLFAILKNGKGRYGEVVPAGVLYMHTSAISSQFNDFDEQKVLTAFSKKLRMNGLLLDDKDSVLMMEYDGAGSFIPLSLDKNGEIKKPAEGRDAPCFSGEQLDILQKYIDEKIKNMAQGIRSGKLSPDPISQDSGSVCDYCDYKKLCGSRNISTREQTNLKNTECYFEMERSLLQKNDV